MDQNTNPAGGWRSPWSLLGGVWKWLSCLTVLAVSLSVVLWIIGVLLGRVTVPTLTVNLPFGDLVIGVKDKPSPTVVAEAGTTVVSSRPDPASLPAAPPAGVSQLLPPTLVPVPAELRRPAPPTAVAVVVPQPPAGEGADIVLLVDRSASAAGPDKEPFARGRAWAGKWAEQLGEQHSVSLLAGNSSSKWPLKDQSVTACRDELKQRVGNLFASGGSNVLANVAEALDHLAKRPAGRAASLVVVTSGLGSAESPSASELAARSSAGGVTVHAVFTCDEGPDTPAGKVLSRLARATGGRCWRADREPSAEVCLALK